MFEIAVREYPHDQSVVGVQRLLQEIAMGRRSVDLAGRALECKRYRVGQSFKKRTFEDFIYTVRCRAAETHLALVVLKRCTSFDPSLRPSIEEVASKLALIKPSTRRSINKNVAELGSKSIVAGLAWPKRIVGAMETFASRLENPNNRDLLGQLTTQVREYLGARAVDITLGVWNPARLYLALIFNEMDVVDAAEMVILNSTARTEFGANIKRNLIVSEHLGFSNFPRAAEWRGHQAHNLFLGRSKNGRVVNYYAAGSAADFDGESQCVAFPGTATGSSWSSDYTYSSHCTHFNFPCIGRNDANIHRGRIRRAQRLQE